MALPEKLLPERLSLPDLSGLDMYLVNNLLVAQMAD